MSNFQFISNRNYMKKHSSSGATTMLGPNVDFWFGSGYKRQLTIPHNLGYVPMFRVDYEPYRDGRVMEAFQDNAWFLPSSPNEVRVTEVAPTLMAWADTFNLYLSLYYINNGLASNSYPVYYTIYEDYGVTA